MNMNCPGGPRTPETHQNQWYCGVSGVRGTPGQFTVMCRRCPGMVIVFFLLRARGAGPTARGPAARLLAGPAVVDPDLPGGPGNPTAKLQGPRKCLTYLDSEQETKIYILVVLSCWPVFGQSWGQERLRLEKRCINQRKLARKIDSKSPRN